MRKRWVVLLLVVWIGVVGYQSYVMSYQLRVIEAQAQRIQELEFSFSEPFMLAPGESKEFTVGNYDPMELLPPGTLPPVDSVPVDLWIPQSLFNQDIGEAIGAAGGYRLMLDGTVLYWDEALQDTVRIGPKT